MDGDLVVLQKRGWVEGRGGVGLEWKGVGNTLLSGKKKKRLDQPRELLERGGGKVFAIRKVERGCLGGLGLIGGIETPN